MRDQVLWLQQHLALDLGFSSGEGIATIGVPYLLALFSEFWRPCRSGGAQIFGSIFDEEKFFHGKQSHKFLTFQVFPFPEIFYSSLQVSFRASPILVPSERPRTRLGGILSKHKTVNFHKKL